MFVYDTSVLVCNCSPPIVNSISGLMLRLDMLSPISHQRDHLIKQPFNLYLCSIYRQLDPGLWQFNPSHRVLYVRCKFYIFKVTQFKFANGESFFISLAAREDCLKTMKFRSVPKRRLKFKVLWNNENRIEKPWGDSGVEKREETAKIRFFLVRVLRGQLPRKSSVRLYDGSFS